MSKFVFAVFLVFLAALMSAVAQCPLVNPDGSCDKTCDVNIPCTAGSCCPTSCGGTYCSLE